VPKTVLTPSTAPKALALTSGVNASSEAITEPHRSSRLRAPLKRYGDEVMLLLDNDEPATFKESMMGPDSVKWQKAMKSEIESMYENQVWSLVDPPEGSRPIECKWIYKKKTDADENVSIYKSRLIAKGFQQIQGIDYDETFSPVAMLKSIRILLAIAAYYNYEIWQMDVKTMFLYGMLTEDVHMVQLEGFVDLENAGNVCKLQRSIYGLKQASRSWNHRFDEVVKMFGFIKNPDEACVYKKVSGSIVAFLVLYVDDILLIENNIPFLNKVKDYLKNKFSMKDLGEAAYILDIKIYRDRTRRLIGLSQDTYLDKVVKRFHMENSKKGMLPMITGKPLSKAQRP
jgi:hypothetical protein